MPVGSLPATPPFLSKSAENFFLTRVRCSAWQNYESNIAIIKSLKSVKGVKISINARFWGEEYAAGAENDTVKGVIDRWEKASTKTDLMVLWEGYNRNQRAPLVKMDTDALGEDLCLTLLAGR